MASKGQEVMSLVLVLIVMAWGGARAQSSGCTNTLMGLTPCLNYVTGNSSTPSPSCCSQLSNVVQSQPRCLCSLLNGSGPNIGVTINQTLAVTLPGACNVQTPPLSLCNVVANGPASGPTSSVIPPTGSQTEETPETEAPTTSSTPTDPSVSGSGPGSKSTPSTDNNTSKGSKFGAPNYLMFFVLFFGMKF